MSERRVEGGVKRGRRFEIEVDGESLAAYEGETVAAALMAAGRRTMRYTAEQHHPRGLYCGIGLCHECLMVIDGVANTRACQTLVAPGMQVQTQEGLGDSEVEQ